MKTYLAVLGRQPEISLAELAALFHNVRKIAPELATFEAEDTPNIDRLGGSLKVAERLDGGILDYLLALPEGKITLGISDYSRKATVRSVRAEAMRIKKALVKEGRSVRIVENKSTVLSTASAHHNRLGIKPRAVEIICFGGQRYLSLGAQNITAYARRDQARPARDAKVGMLPPKLAQILINLCGELPAGATVLDPFCGTGVVLQEAYLMRYRPYGTDKDERMVRYARRNMEWLAGGESNIKVADATTAKWEGPIDAVACETYLGSPMSRPPVEIKLKTEQEICRDIIIGFLKNLQGQIRSGTPVVLAVPAWLRPNGEYAKLDLDVLDELEYNRGNEVGYGDLLYHRDGQVVARNIITLRKK